MQQLSLPLAFEMECDFRHFYPGTQNIQLMAALGQLFTEHSSYPLGISRHHLFRCLVLWSSQCVGKSHLLQACCVAADQVGLRASYLPLANNDGLTLDVFENIASSDVIAIDDLQVIISDPAWEEALFHAYNQLQAQGKILVFSSQLPAQQLAVALPDLRSRLRASEIYQLTGLSDEEKLKALLLRAECRGIVLSPEVARFLLSRVPRDWHSLMAVLDELDHVTIARKRKVTIPLIKETLPL